MAGVTDTVFRKLVKSKGADVLVTEFVSADGILHRNDRTRRYVEFDNLQRPVGVQLFGADPLKMADGAKAVIDWVHPDFIDINFGCPVNKVVAKNGGSSLLRNCPILARVAGAVVRAAAPLPVSAKIRIGWDAHSINSVEVARALELEGISAIAVHGRTRAQGYSGEANWNVIGETAAAVSVPVIGNGDISSPEFLLRRLKETSIRGAMIGRAALPAPWLFAQCRAALLRGTPPPEPDLPGRWAFIRDFARMAVEYRGDEAEAMRSMRSRLIGCVRGMPDSRILRAKLSSVASLAELDEIISESLATHSGGAVSNFSVAASA